VLEVKWARFEKDGNTLFGRVDGDHVRVSQGTVFDNTALTKKVYALSDVNLLPPSLPTKVVCVAHNYRGLIEQIGEPFPEEPILFLKPPSCLIGHEDVIIIPSDAERVIFEGELAVIIKKEMRHVPAEQTLSYVAGYSCFNDTTERAMIERDHYMLSLGKGMDTFGPCGPFLVDGVNPNTLDITTYLNGKEMQRDNTSNCIFSVEFLLQYICHRITLFPGDIVTTGTPQGVDTLLPGDVVEVEIEKLGRLKNPVVSEPK
jgi:2-keto-4-pentenoate hydratase/2-oxohepta-3-ene-1,7-dioic acid hydratase in catechol pathway